MKEKFHLLPRLINILEELGENIKLARLRRKLSAEQVAQRAGLSRKTLYNIERGSPGVSIGNFIQVLLVLGLEKDLGRVGKDDLLGRKLQDAGILINKRAPKRSNKGRADER